MTNITLSLCIILLAALGACASVGVTSNKSSSNSVDSAATSNQVNSTVHKDQLKFTVSASVGEWRLKGSDASSLDQIKLHVENSSDQDIEIRGRGAIHLHNANSTEARDQFYSSSALPGSTTTSSTAGSEQTIRRSWIKCGKHGVLDLVIDARSLKWGRTIGAEGPNREFAEVLPPGTYDLFFTFMVAESLNSGITEGTLFESNKVSIVIR